jgi:hypothetical protein
MLGWVREAMENSTGIYIRNYRRKIPRTSTLLRGGRRAADHVSGHFIDLENIPYPAGMVLFRRCLRKIAT